MHIRLTLIIFSMLGICGIILTYAHTHVQRKAQIFAEKYMENSLENSDWRDNNPHIEPFGIPYYVDNHQPSYIEFQVVCENNPFCGIIIVNIDGNDVKIPIATTSGVGPSKVLTRQGEEEYTKIYYFGPFDQWSFNERTGEVQAIDPKYYPNGDREKGNQDELQSKFQELKNNVAKVKESEYFQSQLQNIKEMEYGFNKDDFAYQIINKNYAYYHYPGIANKTVAGTELYGCGLTPCYSQFTANGHNCPIGCGPVAITIILGYHVNNGKYSISPSLYASAKNDSSVENVMKDIHTLVETSCFNGEGYTYSIDMLKSVNYLIDTPYTASSVFSGFVNTDETLFNNIKNNININMPIILRTPTHFMVVFGYNPTASNRIIRANLGWGNESHLYENNTAYATRDINYDMNAINLGGFFDQIALSTISYWIHD